MCRPARRESVCSLLLFQLISSHNYASHSLRSTALIRRLKFRSQRSRGDGSTPQSSTVASSPAAHLGGRPGSAGPSLDPSDGTTPSPVLVFVMVTLGYPSLLKRLSSKSFFFQFCLQGQVPLCEWPQPLRIRCGRLAKFIFDIMSQAISNVRYNRNS